MGITSTNQRAQSSLRRRSRTMSEINVTPFVDVMLVLLIVFMITAPLMTVGVPVDLPETEAGSISDETEPLVISIKPDGEIYLQESPITLETLTPRLRAITGENNKARIFIRGDKALNYGTIMEIMGTITSAGFEKVALITEMPKVAQSTQKHPKVS